MLRYMVVKKLTEYDLVFFLDSCKYDRFTNEDYPKFKFKRGICIDHHKDMPDSFDLTIVENNKSSATQIIADLFFSKKLFSQKLIAELALYGILDDSGILRFVEYQGANTYSTVRNIVEISKVNTRPLIDRLTSLSPVDIILWQDLFNNLTYIDIENGDNIVYTYLSQEILDNEDYVSARKRANDNFKKYYLNNIRDYPVGFTINPKHDDKEYSLSVRCSEDSSPKARDLGVAFDGGGHNCAAGGKLPYDPEKYSREDIANIVIDKYKEINGYE
jgi:nanoRNase/pAp phosphatase (c-di-AMP/oligoRNAs hydrolase)